MNTKISQPLDLRNKILFHLLSFIDTLLLIDLSSLRCSCMMTIGPGDVRNKALPLSVSDLIIFLVCYFDYLINNGVFHLVPMKFVYGVRECNTWDKW